MTFLVALLAISAVQAAECSRSNNTMLITYSPSDLNVGEEFNLSFIDLFDGANQQVTLHYPSAIQRLSASDTITLTNDGSGGGYYTWRMNSSAPGDHTVYITASYENCNVTRIIQIQTTLLMPQINISYGTIGDIIANQRTTLSLIINSTGAGTAYNVTGWTNFGSVIDTFTYPELATGSSTTRDFSIETATCGNANIDSTVNYQDNFGYKYQPSHISQTVNVKGSDLVIEEFAVSDDKVEKGDMVEFTVKVRNNAGSNLIDATNAVVKLYRGSDLIETIDLGDIDSGSSKSDTVKWKAGKAGTATITAVVDSDNECSNWDNNEETLSITIKKADEEDVTPQPQPEEQLKPQQPHQQPQQQQQPEETKEDGFEWIYMTIGLEVIVLALSMVYVAKTKRRR